MAMVERPDAHVLVHARAQMLEYKSIVMRIARDRPEAVLDWGCGIGQVTDLLGQAGLRVTAFDYAPELDANEVRPLPRYPHFDVHLSPDPVRLPFTDDSFDAVLSCGVLEHVADPDSSLEEIRRVLRAGGPLYVFKLPNRFSYLERIARLLGLYFHGKLPDDAVYSLRSARRLLETHGYEVRELRRANMLPLTLSGALSARIAPLTWLVSRGLARVPLLNAAATNIELIAVARR